MILVKPSFEIEVHTGNAFEVIERAGRTCYKSKDRIDGFSAKKFTGMILKKGHESVIEHASMTVRFVCDRGVSHELVRHRLCAFSQESTRYCNYKGGVTFVIPPWIDVETGEYREYSSLPECNCDVLWFDAMLVSEQYYLTLLERGQTPQQARTVLPNSLKTEIVITANMREWRHILKLRTSSAAHPQMREIMIPLLTQVKINWPELFDDIEA